MSVQAKLLRVLQEGEVSRLGSSARVIAVDVRVLSASHRDLEAAVSAGNFRQDLYFRIATHLIRVPPVREHLEDIGVLAVFFIARICERFGMPVKQIRSETIACLQAYDWHRNNIRELENIVERMIIQCHGTELLPEHIPAGICDQPVPPRATGKTLRELKEQAERHILLQALQANDWHITNTAKVLGIANHSNLLKMMRRLDISRPPR